MRVATRVCVRVSACARVRVVSVLVITMHETQLAVELGQFAHFAL